MGSKAALLAFEQAAKPYGIWLEWERCHTVMSFANSETAVLNWCAVIHWPTSQEVVTTVDMHENGDIPILMSLSLIHI